MVQRFQKLVPVSFEPELYQLKGITSVPGLGHCITGRGGGVSEDRCLSLNIAFHAGDRPENVRENRRRIFTTLELDPDRVFFQQQVHRARITQVPDEWSQPSPYSAQDAVPETDALLTNQLVYLVLLLELLEA